MNDKTTTDNLIPEIPEETYEFLKLKEEKEYKLRVVSPIICGYEGWIEEVINGKTVRTSKKFKTKEEADKVEFSPGKYDDPNEKAEAVFFWAMIVWNYELEALQVFQVNQKTIQKKIKALSSDTEWGHPRNYDIKITRINNKPVEYSINTSPPKSVKKEIIELYKKVNPDLDLLFSNGHPLRKKRDNEDAPF